jgi:hypothetical protein
MKQALVGVSDEQLLNLIKLVSTEFADILQLFDKPSTPALHLGNTVIEAVTFIDEDDVDDDDEEHHDTISDGECEPTTTEQPVTSYNHNG